MNCAINFPLYKMYQLRLKKMRAKSADLSHCAVPFLSRADASLRWYYCKILYGIVSGFFRKVE